MATVAAIAETTANANNEEQLVTMIVDRQLFGVPILQVQDIVEAAKITPVPLSTSAIAGMLNLRGRIVTVIDLRKLLGNDEEVPRESQMGVTVDYKGDLYTLLVDEIGDVRSVRRSDFDKAPTTLQSETRRLCSGIYRLQGNLLVVLEVSRILTPEVIAATQVLTVAERRARKATALEAAKGDESDTRQLSSHMTGFSDYDAESETAKTDQSLDDIKQRKKENRSRRPVAERWREAMEERARQTGQTVYRVREPDKETLDAAREGMADEEAAWQARIKGGVDPVESESGDAPGDLGELPDEGFSDEAFSDEALSDMPFLDEPVPTDSLPEEMVSDEPVSDEPIAGDEFAASDLAEIPADEIAPVADESADVAEQPVADFTELPEDQPAVDDVSDPVVDESATAYSPEMPVDEPAVEDVIEPADDTAVVPEMPEDGDAPAQAAADAADNDKSGVLSGFWNKLRGPDKKDKKTVSDEPPTADQAAIFDDIPASDEAPIADDDMIPGDEAIVKDEPKTAKKSAKSASKAKSAGRKKTPAKRKSPKTGKS